MPTSLAIYCADIGSVPNRRFGWAHADVGTNRTDHGRGGSEIAELVEAVCADLAAHHPVALGFECPLYVPVPEEAMRLGTARRGEGNRSWSAGAGAGAMATGVVQVAWILDQLRRRAATSLPFLDWDEFRRAGSGLFLWEAFVTDRAKAATHVDDAALAAAAFRDAIPDVAEANAIAGDRPLSLLGAALLWSGWSTDLDLLHSSCIAIKATPAAGVITGTADHPTR